MEVDLGVEIAGIKLKNPVLIASGTFGSGKEYSELIDLNELGAIVVKTLTLKPRQGNPPPRICETPAGMLNSIGLQNEGIEVFLANDLPFLASYQVPIIVSIAGNSVDEFCRLAKALDKAPGVAALELNISCPNDREGGIIFGTDPKMSAELVAKIKLTTNLPLIVKLTPNVTDIVPIAKEVERAGAHAISLINTLFGMAVDVNSRRPRLASVVGGLSGPAIKPVALYLVWQVAKAVRIPVIGIGGISSAEDALEFILAGASGVAIGTANFIDPQTPLKVVEGIKNYLLKNRIPSVSKLIGALKV